MFNIINVIYKYYIYPKGTEVANDDEQGPTLTGHITDPIKYKILDNTNMFLSFKTSRNSQYIGFVLTYAPFGKIDNLK